MVEHVGTINIKEKKYWTLVLYGNEQYDNNECLKINNKINEPNEQKKIKFLQKMYVPTDDNLSSEDYNNWKCSLDINNPKNAKLYKYRYYLKVAKTEEGLKNNGNILTFILFNPSYANQYTLDPTINNCAHITFNLCSYDGFEILNLLNIRTTSIDNLDNTNCNNLDLYKDDIKKIMSFHDVVLAWGVSSSKNRLIANMKESWAKFCNLKEGMPEICRAISYKYKDSQEIRAWHLGNQGWSSKGIKQFINNLQIDKHSNKDKSVVLIKLSKCISCIKENGAIIL